MNNFYAMISLPGGAIIGLILAVIIIIVGAFLISNVIKFAKSQDEVIAEGYLEALAQAIDKACNEGDDEQLVWLPSDDYLISISNNGGCFRDWDECDWPVCHNFNYQQGSSFDAPCIINGTSYTRKVICLVKLNVRHCEIVKRGGIDYRVCNNSEVVACYYLPKHASDCEKDYSIEDVSGNGNITIAGKVKVKIKRRGYSGGGGSGGGVSGTLEITTES